MEVENPNWWYSAWRFVRGWKQIFKTSTKRGRTRFLHEMSYPTEWRGKGYIEKGYIEGVRLFVKGGFLTVWVYTFLPRSRPMKILVLFLTSLLPACFAADAASDLQKKFVGSWRLISQEGVYPTDVSGIIMYDETGHMSVQIMRRDRPPFPNALQKATEQEKAGAFDTYTAYYGTYTFEPENGIVIHHLEGSLRPPQIGQDNIRYFELNGNRLTLRIANDGKGGRLARKDTTGHVTWEKIPAK
jgi:hypothetical protein